MLKYACFRVTLNMDKMILLLSNSFSNMSLIAHLGVFHLQSLISLLKNKSVFIMFADFKDPF